MNQLDCIKMARYLRAVRLIGSFNTYSLIPARWSPGLTHTMTMNQNEVSTYCRPRITIGKPNIYPSPDYVDLIKHFHLNVGIDGTITYQFSLIARGGIGHRD